MHPVHKLLNLRMGAQRIPGVIAPSELSGLEDLMDLLMADPMEEKLRFASLRSRHQMMLVRGWTSHQQPSAERAVLGLLG